MPPALLKNTINDMSYNITPFADPLMYDKVAQEINTELGSTFDDQLGVCWVRTEEEQTVPEAYANDGTKVNFRVMPDRTRSLSYFTIEGDLIELDEMHFTCPMALTFWVNLAEYDQSKAYDYTTELIRTVTNVIRKYGGYDFSVNVLTPFEGFSMLDKEVDANTMRPYSAVKVSFTKNVQICDS